MTKHSERRTPARSKAERTSHGMLRREPGGHRFAKKK
jgi:hypothetical protein